MKSVMITFDQAFYERIIQTLDRLNCRGFSYWQQVQGRGSSQGAEKRQPGAGGYDGAAGGAASEGEHPQGYGSGNSHWRRLRYPGKYPSGTADL